MDAIDDRPARFLSSLLCLMEVFEATMSYTNGDDGIHIEVAGKEVFAGFLDDGLDDLKRAVRKL